MLSQKLDNADLIKKSQWLRKELFRMNWGDGKDLPPKRGLIPSCFSMTEVTNFLFYGGVLRGYDPGNPKSLDRDTFIISKGHASSIVYPILADLGFFPQEELGKYATRDGILTPYAMHTLPGIDTMTGSLGHGFGISAGIALANKLGNSPWNAYCVLGDGECNEGSIWEVAQFAAHYGLDNLVAIVDRNKHCILGEVDTFMGIEPLDKKFESFGWHTQRINGHSYREIREAFKTIEDQRTYNGEGHQHTRRMPFAIVADTVKGMGVSYMAADGAKWHNKKPNSDQIRQASEELEVNCIKE